MGRIRNFFNRIFGKNQKTLGEAKPRAQGVPLDIVPPQKPEVKEESIDNFKEDLQKNTIQKNEMSFDETLDYFIQQQKLDPICKNPRGREKLGNMLENVLKKEKVKSEDGVYNKISVEYALERTFGKSPEFERESITFVDRDHYDFDNDRENSKIAPGCEKTTISVDKYDQLSEVTEGRGSYLYNTNPDEKDKPIQVVFSKSEHHYEKSGIEDVRTEQSCRFDNMQMRGEYYQAEPAFDYAFLNYHNESTKNYPNYKATLARRQDGILAEVHVVGQEGRNKHVYLNAEHGVDDLVTTDESIEARNYLEMTEEQKEKFKSKATDAISRSKYKEDLVDQTPGVGMEDIEKNKSRD